MLILSRFKVSGHSMMPALNPGQEILVSSIPYLIFKPKVGDVIAFKEGEKFIVKRIKEIKDWKFRVEGDNKHDSKEYGWIDGKTIIGKVLYP